MDRLVLSSKVPLQKTVVVDTARLIIIPPEDVGKINLICIRSGNEFKNSAFYLVDKYEWILGTDSGGDTVLVPLKRIYGEYNI